MRYGERNHPPREKLKQELFICYVLEKLRKQPDRQKRGILFDTLTWGRDDIDELREEIKKRW